MGTIPPPATIPPSATEDSGVQPNPPVTGLAGQAHMVASALGSGSSSDSISATAALMNLLLPNVRSEAMKQQNVWVGTGLPALPKKLYDRILRWEYIDFAELRPVDPLEAVNPEPYPVQYVMLPNMEITRAKKKPIKDIHTWTSCFAVYVAVLSSKFPECSTPMMAYLLTILKAHREFANPGWRMYDEAFRTMAAATGLRNWSSQDEPIYGRILTGHARVIDLCKHCSSTSHTSATCPDFGTPLRKRVRESTTPYTVGSQAKFRKPNVCWDFNSGRCSFNPCRYGHICSICAGRHPRINCKSRRGTQQEDHRPGGGQGRRDERAQKVNGQ